jgi:tRNA A-37 threonylcarbamoyl transferase component Bud32
VTPDGGDEQPHRIGERYALKRELGAGGMGVVYEGVDELLDRPVAVKEVLLPRFKSRAEREKLAARVMREARAAARLNHPGAVTTYDIVMEQGTTYIVMELVNARTLDELIEEDGPVSPEAAAGLGLQLLAVLEAAHARGIVHRDVKPANVMVLPDGATKLTDFGIATMHGDPKLTTTGVVLGSPTYMSPEHASGYESGPPADLYSLGATMYYAVEGEPPFQRPSPLATMTAVVHDQPRPMRRAGQLATVIRLLMAKRPDSRPTAVGIRGMLEDVVSHRPLDTFEGAPPPTTGRFGTPASGRAVAPPPAPATGAYPTGVQPAGAHAAGPEPTGVWARPAGTERLVSGEAAPADGSTGTSRYPIWAAPAGDRSTTSGPVGPPDAPAPPTDRYPAEPTEHDAPAPPPRARQFVVTMPGPPDLPGLPGPPATGGGHAGAADPSGPSLVERARSRQGRRRGLGAGRDDRDDHVPRDAPDRRDLPSKRAAAAGARAARADGSRRRARVALVLLAVVLLAGAAAVVKLDLLPGRGGARGGEAPPGWVTYAHPKGVYRLSVPQGWTVVERDDRVTDFIVLGERTHLRVQWSPTRRDPERALNDDVQAFRRTHAGFHALDSGTRTIAGRTAAMLDFQYVEGGETTRATHLALAGKDRRTFFIEFSAPEGDWAKRAGVLRQIERGFLPVG